ncbi:hypothetical protein BCON_0150g00150 [Botryotinia convoluta]|uniref:Uncharacterized protein n=1 Tax=Botryotinia convoluta TaxID=54673 RepID=A0A4Z1I4V8_9HELO|nr:hypothetical protein BCON_0150g00150 [Botryotinia convoluta]
MSSVTFQNFEGEDLQTAQWPYCEEIVSPKYLVTPKVCTCIAMDLIGRISCWKRSLFKQQELREERLWYSSGLREQNEATKREGQRDKPRGSGLKYVEEPKYTSAREQGLDLWHPKPDQVEYTAAQIFQGLQNLEASPENEADHQSGANEHSAAGRNTPLQQRYHSKQKATSTLAPPKKHNNHKIPRKPLSKEPAKKSDFTHLSQIEYGNVLATGANPSSQPLPKATIPSQSRPKHKISDIQKKSSSHHGAHSDVASDFNDSRPPNWRRNRVEDERTNSTRGQNKELIIHKTRDNPALPPRDTHKKDGSSTPQQQPQVSRPRAVAGQHHRHITSDMRESRQVSDSVPRSHTTQRHNGQPPVKYSDPSCRVRRRDDELHLWVPGEKQQ